VASEEKGASEAYDCHLSTLLTTWVKLGYAGALGPCPVAPFPAMIGLLPSTRPLGSPAYATRLSHPHPSRCTLRVSLVLL
jgi:hypothetical protein